MLASAGSLNSGIVTRPRLCGYRAGMRAIYLTSCVADWSRCTDEVLMKKTKDEMRAEYKRSDFSKLGRGKFYKEMAKGTSVVLLDPAIAKAFPTSEAVNAALLGLLTLTEQTASITGRTKRTTRKPA